MPNFLRRPLWIVENIPTILFFALWRSGADLDQAAWAAAFAAFIVFCWLRETRRSPDTILLGINLHFVLTASIIQAVYVAGFEELAREMIVYAGFAVPVMILLTGIALSVLWRDGFIGENVLDPDISAARSLALILWAAVTCVWSYAFIGDQFLSVGLPVISIFAMRRLLRNPEIRLSRFLTVMTLFFARPIETSGRAARSPINEV